MCLGAIAFNAIFHKNNSEFREGKLTDMLMGPSFQVYDAKNKAARPAMQAREKEIITVHTFDGLSLNGFFYKCPKESVNTVILVHGFNSSPFMDFPTIVAFYLANGYNVLCTNNRGGKLGDGKYTTFGLYERLDTALWVDEIARRYPDGDIYLHGCSMGAATVCLMSELPNLKNLRAIISDCAFTSIRDEFSATCKHIIKFEPKLLLNASYKRYKKKFGHDVDEFTPLKAVANAKYPVLFIHGIKDRFISKTQCERLYNACTAAKEVLFIEEAGHAASFNIDEAAYSEKVLGWLKSHTTR